MSSSEGAPPATRYWFARRTSVGRPSMSPVSREGWLVAIGFVVAMLTGGALFGVLMWAGAMVLGICIFVVVAATAGGMFIWLAVTHGDYHRTVADYRRMAKGGST